MCLIKTLHSVKLINPLIRQRMFLLQLLTPYAVLLGLSALGTLVSKDLDSTHFWPFYQITLQIHQASCRRFGDAVWERVKSLAKVKVWTVVIALTLPTDFFKGTWCDWVQFAFGWPSQWHPCPLCARMWLSRDFCSRSFLGLRVRWTEFPRPFLLKMAWDLPFLRLEDPLDHRSLSRCCREAWEWHQPASSAPTCTSFLIL